MYLNTVKALYESPHLDSYSVKEKEKGSFSSKISNKTKMSTLPLSFNIVLKS